MAALADDMAVDHPGEAVLVVSNVPGAGGLAKAQARGIATALVDHRQFESREDFEADLITVLDHAEADILCFAGFMRILTDGFIARYAGRMLNIHPSLLPKYPGLHTHQRALDAGDTAHGCTVHEVTTELDGGPILGQARVAILPNETADALAARVLVQEHKLYPAVLRRVLLGNRTPLFLP